MHALGQLTPFQEAFFDRCKKAGCTIGQTIKLIDRTEAEFSKDAADELRDGLEKVAAGWLDVGKKMLPKAWSGMKGFFSKPNAMAPLTGAATAAGKTMHNTNAMAPLTGMAASTASKAAPNAMGAITGARPGMPARAWDATKNFFFKASPTGALDAAGNAVTRRPVTQALGQAGAGAVRGVVGGMTAQDLTGNDDWGTFAAGAGAGILGGNKRFQQSALGQSGLYQNAIRNPLRGAMTGSVAGSAVDTGASLLGYDTGGAGGRWGSRMGLAAGAVPGLNRGQFLNAAGKPGQPLLGQASQMADDLMQGVTAPINPSQWSNVGRMARMNPGAVQGLGTAGKIGLGVGTAGAGLTAGRLGVNAAGNFIEQRSREGFNNAVLEATGGKHDLNSLGPIINQAAEGSQQAMGFLQQLGNLPDQLLGMIMSPEQLAQMSPMTKWMLLIGGGTMLGGLLSGSGGATALGGAAMMGGALGGFPGLSQGSTGAQAGPSGHHALPSGMLGGVQAPPGLPQTAQTNSQAPYRNELDVQQNLGRSAGQSAMMA
jgi:hypothetical protein